MAVKKTSIKKKSAKVSEKPISGTTPKESKSVQRISKIERKPLNSSDRKKLYAARQYLNKDIREKVGLQIPFDVYLQDPLVVENGSTLALDEILVNWEPGLGDGPTSARFAVVDFNGDSGTLVPPAIWDPSQEKFIFADNVLDKKQSISYQFHQVSVWATLQNALDFFEDGFGLGRPIPWAFEGNRLMVVPHAGYGENAFYDRESKSLQFYYFGPERDPVYTCLSGDIVNHEFGHAVLDGVRPYYSESTLIETAAFHEFIGDITAILILLRNNRFRGALAKQTKGQLSKAKQLSSIAEQFGQRVNGKPYLRTALNKDKMSNMVNETSHHRVSQVLTGAMFDILMSFSDYNLTIKNQSPLEAFWNAVQHMQRTVVQPLDLLPPVDVTFRDYAMAVLRADQLSNPIDPENYYQRMIEVFHKRGIISSEDVKELQEPRYLFHRLRLSVYHDIDDISRSRAAAYRFLDDNRDDLFIPSNQDFIIADLYDSNKYTREARRLPRQIVLEYLWQEEVEIVGKEYARFDNHSTTMYCGGTLVFDDKGNVLSWARKPGTYRPKSGTYSPVAHKKWEDEALLGDRRRKALLAGIAIQIEGGRIGMSLSGENGLIGDRVPPVTAEVTEGLVQFKLSPHLHLSDDEHEEDMGDRQWEISC